MKKYFLLIFIAISILIIMFFINENIENNIPKVNVKILKRQEVTNTINAWGYIENNGGKEVRYNLPIYIDKIFVSEGDYVNYGDKIFTINKEKTVDFLINGGYLNSITNEDIDYSLITALPSVVTASNSGYVSSISYEENTLYDMLNPIMILSEKDDYRAVLQVSEDSLKEIKIGQKVNLKCDAISNKKFSGKIKRIENHANQKLTENASIERVVKIYVDNLKYDENLKSGFSVQGTIILDKSKKVIAPYSSILQDGEGEYLYLLKNGYIEKTYIKTEGDFSKGSAVSSSYNGAKIIENPQKLKGDKIKIVS